MLLHLNHTQPLSNKHRYQNKQKWCECQLISLWNAAVYHGKIPPRYGSKQYRFLCEQAGTVIGERQFAKEGVHIRLDHELRRLNMDVKYGRWDFKWVRKNLPVALTVESENLEGCYHNVLAVDVNVRKKQFLIANLKLDGNAYWVKWSYLNGRRHNIIIPRAYISLG